MCTSITAQQHAAFQDGGAFVIPTRPGGRGDGGGEREVRIRGVGQGGLGSRLGCWGRVDAVDKVGWGVLQDKEILVGF